MKLKYIYASWLIAFIATLGSLFFSNVMQLPPCNLCWWQRICMYPLVLIFSSAYIFKDKTVIKYSGPIISVGFIISIYHNLLYYGIIPKSLSACTQGLSCTSIQLNWFGFITIPLLSLTAFSLLTLISITSIFKKENQNE